MKDSATGRYLNKWLHGAVHVLCGNTSSFTGCKTYYQDAYVYVYEYFQLDSQAFSNLNVKKHNYSEVDKLYLDNNQLDSLPEKLLKMRLKVRFSARNNKLTTVSILLIIL